jgi:hypothetical protein
MSSTSVSGLSGGGEVLLPASVFNHGRRRLREPRLILAGLGLIVRPTQLCLLALFIPDL